MEIPVNAWYMLSQDQVKWKDHIDKSSADILLNQNNFTPAVGTAGSCLLKVAVVGPFNEKEI